MNNKAEQYDTRSAGLLVAFMWCAYFLNYCDRQAVFAMFPSLTSDLGMSDRQLGLIGAIFLWVYAIGCPLAGYLGDRFSKRLMVVWSLIIWSLVTIATGFSTSATMLLSLRALMGVSESLFMPTAIALTANAHPAHARSRAIATLTTAQIVGTVVGSWFGGWMADRGEWRIAFFALGAVGIVYAIPYFLFLKGVSETPPAQRITVRRENAESIALPSAIIFTVMSGISCFRVWIVAALWMVTNVFTRQVFAESIHCGIQCNSLFARNDARWAAWRRRSLRCIVPTHQSREALADGRKPSLVRTVSVSDWQ